jgi:hypothetical protein
VRVLPSLSRPLDLSPSEVEAIVDTLTARLEGWVIPRLYGSFRSAVEIRVREVLADLETDRALDLTAYLTAELAAGRLVPPAIPLDEDEDEEDRAAMVMDQTPIDHAAEHPPLRLADPRRDRPARRTSDRRTWLTRARARLIGRAIKTGAVLVFRRCE